MLCNRLMESIGTGAPRLSYKFDIFLSYQNDEIMASWVSDHLMPFMRSFVGNAINRQAEIFFDKNRHSPR
jgi:hypothetical protein